MTQNIIDILFYSQEGLITSLQICSVLSLSDITSMSYTVVILFVIVYLHARLHIFCRHFNDPSP
jgi:hypothetical protein